MLLRMLLLVVCVVVVGCGRDADIGAVGRADALGQATLAPSSAVAGRSIDASRPTLRGFADLPDHGELLAYPAKVSRRDGAYTWHRTDMSEQYALRAIAEGHLRITTPSGELLDFRYDRHVEHPSGDWTWIGHLPGHEGEQTILTFGDRAAFGSIAQAGKPALRLTMRDGVSWLVETDPRKVAAIVNAATRPQQPDYRIVSRADLPRRPTGPRAAADGSMTESGGIEVASASATATAASTVDLIIGYTTGFATANGGASGVLTRLNYLVDVANAAYANSNVTAKVRLVKALQVNYTDSNDNETALEQMSGYKSGSGPVTPNAAFNALRSAREQYEADLVSLVRDFREPENNGCGIAWLLGGSLQGISAGEGWDELGYSVVSDGIDAGADGKNYFCRDETLAHEMGHNMGAAHDRATAGGDDGNLDNPDDYGAYTYSFGYKTGAAGGDFYTVMAYGDSGQRSYRIFSTPGTDFCGGRACGTSSSDNVRTLRQTIPVVAGFRVGSEQATSTPLLRQVDVNGNGHSDLLFFNHRRSQLAWWFLDGGTVTAYSAIGLDGRYRLVDAADFNADGRSDLLFTSDSRDLILALGTGYKYELRNLGLNYSTAYKPIGLADVNGDRNADILLRNTSTGYLVVWYMHGTARVAYNGHAIAAKYAFVGDGDFNGDRREDLLWTDADGHLLLSTSQGISYKSGVLAVSHSASSVVAGVQDVNGDGMSDILLALVDGSRVVTWFMNGTNRYAYSSSTIDPAFRIMGKGDFNGDHRGDLLLQNRATQQVRLMLSSGGSFATRTTVGLTPNEDAVLMDVR